MTTGTDNLIKSADQEMINLVIIRGSIMRKNGKPPFISLTIATHPLGRQRNLVRMVWYDEMAEKADGYSQGDTIEARGYIATSKKYRNENIIGREIKEAPAEMEEKLAGPGLGRKAPDINEVRLKGQLIHKFNPEGTEYGIGTIRTAGPERMSYPQPLFFDRPYDKLKEAQEGDDIYVIGHIQSRRAASKGVKASQSVIADNVESVPGYDGTGQDSTSYEQQE